jgi:putative phosphoesterase
MTANHIMPVCFYLAVSHHPHSANMQDLSISLIYIMKVAVLADIHGNLPALMTVINHIDAWAPDTVVVAGDNVNRGPRPLECLQLVMAKRRTDGWLFVRGNHEDYVIKQAQPDAERSGPNFELSQSAYWTLMKLNGNVNDLRTMPFQVAFPAPNDQEVRIAHASMCNNRDGIYPGTPDEELRQKILPPPAVFCVGHTHRPLVRQIDHTLVVNVGAVGMPFDGDYRAAYAQLTWQDNRWKVKIVRLDYDQAQTERDFFDTGFFDEAGDLVKIMLVEFRQSRAHIYMWSRHYEEAVLSGRMSMAESVRSYISSID